MPIIEGIGWVATAVLGLHGTPVADALNDYNNHFAMEVDRGNSCFNRVSGFEGVYGGPQEFDMDLLCNWRLKKVAREGTVYDWILERN